MKSQVTESRLAPGRFCPPEYFYGTKAIKRASEITANTIVVCGGLYGNMAALETIENQHSGVDHIIFGGDFNWFNIDHGDFKEINDRIIRSHLAIRGNVETELSRRSTQSGCGCAYPPTTSDAEVEYSNQIINALHVTADSFPEIQDSFSKLPMFLKFRIGDTQVAVVHGDAENLAGWSFSSQEMRDPSNASRYHGYFTDAGVDIFASSHTCEPAIQLFNGRNTNPRVVINNGSAGMPNFENALHGIATRISVNACPENLKLYGVKLGGLHIDAIKVNYDSTKFLRQFCHCWDVQSPAYKSYYGRITGRTGTKISTVTESLADALGVSD